MVHHGSGGRGERAGLFINRSIPLQKRVKLFEVCFRSVLFCTCETWGLTKKFEDMFVGYDRRVLK